jgi:uncharacterized protein YeaO (DUF488 family)
MCWGDAVAVRQRICYALSRMTAQRRGNTMSLKIAIKRAYEPAAKSDGRRILVDRLWPRGVKRDTAGIDEWMKDVAPSTALRRWFAHDPARWKEFIGRYRKELASPAVMPAIERLRKLASGRKVTLVYAAADSEHNNAVALRTILGARTARK